MKKGKNIYKRKDGRWEARIQIGELENGKKRYKYLYGSSYREAADKKLHYETQYAAAPAPQPPKDLLLFGALSEKWLSTMKAKWKRSTYSRYQICLETNLLPRWGDVPLGQLRQPDYEKLMEELSGSLKSNSLQAVRTVLNGVMKYAIRSGYLDAPPFTTTYPPGRQDHSHTDVLSAAEVKKMTDYCRLHPSQQTLGIMIALYGGLRIGEICALRWDDIDVENHLLYVRHTLQRIALPEREDGKRRTELHIGPPKNNRARTIPLHRELADFLQNEAGMHPGDHFVLRGRSPCEPRAYSRYFKKHLEAAGIREVNFHTLRHTFASRCVEKNVDVKALSEFLGHSSIRITMDRYVHLTMQFMQAQMQQLDFTETV